MIKTSIKFTQCRRNEDPNRLVLFVMMVVLVLHLQVQLSSSFTTTSTRTLTVMNNYHHHHVVTKNGDEDTRMIHTLMNMSTTNTNNDNDHDTSSESSSSSSTTTLNVKGLEVLKRDRYVATNRFAVRKNKGAKFEARWANRKSRLSQLQGFKYFHLMRRVKFNDDDNNDNNNNDVVVYDEGNAKDGSNMGNYVSFTIWEKKSDFSSWRKGEAFKEAHGGTSISAFMSTMISSALILKGPPRPAFYDGLLLQSTQIQPEDVPLTVDGWRNIQADGITNLPTECFVVCNQFYVPFENGPQFEQRWANRESTLKQCDGFVAFVMMRRDIGGKGHGVVPFDEQSEPTYVSTTIWKNREAFENWRKGTAFQKAHGQQQSSASVRGEQQQPPPSPPKPLWTKPPSPVFYEGTLVISKPEGA